MNIKTLMVTRRTSLLQPQDYLSEMAISTTPRNVVSIVRVTIIPQVVNGKYHGGSERSITEGRLLLPVSDEWTLGQSV